MDLGLKGRAALVTGASQGSGLAVATELASDGCNVTFVARSQDKRDAASAALSKETGQRISTKAVDLTVSGEPDKAVEGHLAVHGRLDILVNNAGAARGSAYSRFQHSHRPRSDKGSLTQKRPTGERRQDQQQRSKP